MIGKKDVDTKTMIKSRKQFRNSKAGEFSLDKTVRERRKPVEAKIFSFLSDLD